MRDNPHKLRVVEPYDEDYFERGLQTGKSRYENYRWMPEMALRMAYYIIKHLNIQPGHKVLDFGCAKGYLVKALRILGVEAYGCDASCYAINHVDPEVKEYCRPIEPDTMYLPFPHRFKYIITKDVLEHMNVEQAQHFLTQTKAQCDEQFHIVPLGRDGKYIVPEYELDITHRIRKSKEWWDRLFNRSGWRVWNFRMELPGVKENWTSQYPDGNGFFLLRKRPRFSLVMPTKNRHEFIINALIGVMMQDFRDWELIVKDAGKPIATILPNDARIKYTHMPNATYVEQVQAAFADATGEILNFCADDDVMYPHTLYRVNEKIGDAMWMYGQIERGDNHNRQGDYWNYQTLRDRNIVPLPATFWRREVLDVVGIPDVSIECWDWDYWLRLGARWTPVFIEELLSYYRCHPDMGSVTRLASIIHAEKLIRERIARGEYNIPDRN